MSTLIHSLPASLFLAALFCTGGSGMEGDRFHGGADLLLRLDADIPLKIPPKDIFLWLSELDEEQDAVPWWWSRTCAGASYSSLAAKPVSGSLRGGRISFRGAPKTSPPQPA